MRKFSLLLSLFVPLAACDTAPDAAESGSVTEERGPLGKADNIGSCEAADGGDFCGGASQEGNCWCDDLCESFGDCCGDKPEVCDGVEPPVELCLQDDQCDSGFCDHTECLSNCPDGMICPAVCWGQCAPAEDPGCLASSDCGDEEFCEFESECGEGPVGTCTERPSVCAKIFAPVCGCDGVTYGNACEASASGVSVQSDGACPSDGGSCEGSCGGEADGCWCDDLCEQFGDCCDDIDEACGEASCEELVGAYEAETAAIRACEVAEDCGQVLTGTSCGCTRNWVARNDADLGTWNDLRDQALAAECELSGTISTCDCPAAAGFACDAGICTWDYL